MPVVQPTLPVQRLGDHFAQVVVLRLPAQLLSRPVGHGNQPGGVALCQGLKGLSPSDAFDLVERQQGDARATWAAVMGYRTLSTGVPTPNRTAALDAAAIDAIKKRAGTIILDECARATK